MAQPLGIGHAIILDAHGKGRGRAGLYSSDDPFSLGPYQVRKVHRKWYTAVPSNGTPTIFHWRSRVSKVGWAATGYAYQFTDSGTVWEGDCRFRDSVRNYYQKSWSIDPSGFHWWNLDSASRKTSLGCRCVAGARAARLDMVRIRGSGGGWTGTMIPADTAYRIIPVDEYEDGSQSLGAIGYKFKAPDGVRGAVETIRPGRIWLSPELAEPERAPSACLLTGLILYVEPAAAD